MKRAADGWTVAAIEWVRDVEGEDDIAQPQHLESRPEPEKIPYGLSIAADGLHLEPNPVETTVLLLILEKIVIEKRLSHIAADLNERGFRTRKAIQWTPSAVFNLLPRLIEVGPKLLNSAEWRERRSHLSIASGLNSPPA